MSDSAFFTISDFAKFSRTTRDTLLHYDKIGLLSPVSRGDNNYRYYSRGQLAIVNLIRIFQELGMTLEEIKSLKDSRTPENTSDRFSCQIERIDSKIDKWVRARKLLLTLKNTVHSSLNVDEEKITVQFLPAEAIILGDLNDYSRDRNDYDAFLSFYKAISKKYPDLDLNYPVYGTFSEERIKLGDWVWPDRFYFSNPDGYDRKPAALYAIGYTRGRYGQCGDLYKRMIDYIDSNGLEIYGDAYEEYPLNEVSISDDINYLIRVMIIVREKTSS
jgi:DNA-binding transcriptional MerR regulator